MTKVFELAKMRYKAHILYSTSLRCTGGDNAEAAKDCQEKVWKRKRKAVRNISMGPVLTFNASTGEVDADESL